MGFDLTIFQDQQLQSDYIQWLVDEHSEDINKHFAKLWEYYSNHMYEKNVAGRCYVQAQECGLPPRITAMQYSPNAGILASKAVQDVQRKEIVIENDIAWRVNAAVDFLFSKPISFVSKSPDSQKRAEIEKILKALFAANGGVRFFQDMAVLGSVYGFVDCLIRPLAKIKEHIISSSSTNSKTTIENVLQLVKSISLELIEAPRALPVLEEGDYKKIKCYVQHFNISKNALNHKNSFLAGIFSRGSSAATRQIAAITEIASASAWQRYENNQLVAEGLSPWGFLPVVHIQNVAQPYYYEGISDVEPLIPLQDELNTRLSDRASRITFQSFKMYLGKGIEGFEDRPVSPGRMWCTDNLDASIEEFGGDSHMPSEDAHIAEIREAMDKASQVTPVVAGVLKNKIGNLSSAVALKMRLMGML
ncbi:MAG: phage portal protein [Planctomycetes bacterium]|nr:phage portal protein [Planctomycetota bacterium]